MYHRDIVNIIGGGYLFLLGAFSTFYSYQNYHIGSLSFMGPGYFPVVLGSIIAALGLLIMVAALFNNGQLLKLRVAPTFFVILSIVIFAFLLDWFGLVVASFVSSVTSSLADKTRSWRQRIVLASIVTALAFSIFGIGLGMQLAVWPWNV